MTKSTDDQDHKVPAEMEPLCDRAAAFTLGTIAATVTADAWKKGVTSADLISRIAYMVAHCPILDRAEQDLWLDGFKATLPLEVPNVRALRGRTDKGEG